MFRGELLFCESCGKNHYITIGGGLYIEGFSDNLTRKMKNGAYGEEYKELVNSKPFVFVDGIRKVYYCDNCENWTIEETLDLYSSNATYITIFSLYSNPEKFTLMKEFKHICKKCNHTMRKLDDDEDDKLKCLNCHSDLVSKGHGIDWD